MNYRHELGMVESSPSGAVVIDNHGYCDINVGEYSEFKYGRGDIAREYGMAMARLLLHNHPELLEEDELYVSSSAYKAAPPASNSLVEPFVTTANTLADYAGSSLNVVHFKIDRTNITQGDYAAMTVAEREVIMSRNGLVIPKGVNVSGQKVVALDDIFVTGSHEKSIEKLMQKSGVDTTYYLYIMRVRGGHLSPQIEAQINGTTVTSIDDVLRLAETSIPFIPNARMCKFILSKSESDIARFVEQVDPVHLEKITDYATDDGLGDMESYRAGYESLLAAQGLEPIEL